LIRQAPSHNEELDAIYDQLTTYDASGHIDVLGGDFTWTSMILGRSWASTSPTTVSTITANDPNNLQALTWQIRSLTSRRAEIAGLLRVFAGGAASARRATTRSLRA